MKKILFLALILFTTGCSKDKKVDDGYGSSIFGTWEHEGDEYKNDEVIVLNSDSTFVYQKGFNNPTTCTGNFSIQNGDNFILAPDGDLLLFMDDGYQGLPFSSSTWSLDNKIYKIVGEILYLTKDEMSLKRSGVDYRMKFTKTNKAIVINPVYPVRFDIPSREYSILRKTLPVSFAFTNPEKDDDKLGLGGILVIRNYRGLVYAFDLSCPVERDKDVKIVVDDYIHARCPKCGSVYEIGFSEGLPDYGTKLPLIRYNISGSKITN